MHHLFTAGENGVAVFSMSSILFQIASTFWKCYHLSPAQVCTQDIPAQCRNKLQMVKLFHENLSIITPLLNEEPQ